MLMIEVFRTYALYKITILCINANRLFQAFISQNLVPKLWQGACVVMDNCSIHLGKEIESLIEAAGAKLIYLLPYSPDFSPIENCWSKIKSILRSIGARNYPDLAQAIEAALGKGDKSNLLYLEQAGMPAPQIN